MVWKNIVEDGERGFLVPSKEVKWWQKFDSMRRENGREGERKREKRKFW